MPPERAGAFEAGYYERQYQASAFHARGDKPILNRTRVRILRRHMPQGALLDVGCGEGHFLRHASRHFAVSGTDISEAGVAAAREIAPAAAVQVARAEASPFPDGAFDIVTCFDVVEHLPEPRAFFSEAWRILRPGGSLLLTTPNPEGFGARRKGAQSFMHTDPTHVSLLPMQTWRDLLQGGGFHIVRDGTEPLWDAPYFPGIPRALQKIVFVGSAQLLWCLDVMFPWDCGENYVCLARKPGVTDG